MQRDSHALVYSVDHVWIDLIYMSCPVVWSNLLAGDAQAKLVLIIAQIYLNGERMDGLCLSIRLSVRDSLSLWSSL